MIRFGSNISSNTNRLFVHGGKQKLLPSIINKASSSSVCRSISFNNITIACFRNNSLCCSKNRSIVMLSATHSLNLGKTTTSTINHTTTANKISSSRSISKRCYYSSHSNMNTKKKINDNNVFSAATTAAIGTIGLLLSSIQCYSDSNNTLLSCTDIDKTYMEEKISKEQQEDKDDDDEADETTLLLNWSGTHSVIVENKNYYEPETINELSNIIKQCHKDGKAIRPIGSTLSPNAISFSNKGMISMSNFDKIINVDTDQQTITVESGARVSDVINALRPYNLTLPNLASIAEQQIGGFVSVGAHGTGANISPVDEYVTSLEMITPAKGLISLSLDKDDDDDDELFHLAKVGLGSLGIITQVTMKCIPAHNLVEHTFVLTRQEAKDQCKELLKKHKHVRYMWIPYEDAVVVVTNDPQDIFTNDEISKIKASMDSTGTTKERFHPLINLLKKVNKDVTLTDDIINNMGFGELRDTLLAINPLDGEYVKLVNKVEHEFWKNSQGYQIKPSDELLQFDCGGQQWVLEVCFPTSTVDNHNNNNNVLETNGNDMVFLEALLDGIEKSNIPAPAPIEQRWSKASSSLMSPAYGKYSNNELFSWVGIIMYLPPSNDQQRTEITKEFKTTYCNLLRSISKEYGAVSHWAKLEIPDTIEDIVELRTILQNKYPINKFNNARKLYDPKNILSNDLINISMGDITGNANATAKTTTTCNEDQSEDTTDSTNGNDKVMEKIVLSSTPISSTFPQVRSI